MIFQQSLRLLFCVVATCYLTDVAAAFSTHKVGYHYQQRCQKIGGRHQKASMNTAELRIPTNIYSKKNEEENILIERWSKADLTEIRLDTTLAACHALARFFVFDLTLPKKAIPRFEIEDLIMLSNLFSSVVVLAFLWTTIGLVTRVFEDGGFAFPTRLITTSAIAGPLWVSVEILCHWPPAGITATTTESMAMAIVIGTVGLSSTMALGRIFSSKFLF